MTVNVERLEDENTIIMSIAGRFDFSLHTVFRNAYKHEVISGGVFVVDLAKTEYLDSSALGMLLLLKEHAESMGSIVKIRNQSQGVLEILHIASFDKLFTIE